jgi:hypothetical protein
MQPRGFTFIRIAVRAVELPQGSTGSPPARETGATHARCDTEPNEDGIPAVLRRGRGETKGYNSCVHMNTGRGCPPPTPTSPPRSEARRILDLGVIAGVCVCDGCSLRNGRASIACRKFSHESLAKLFVHEVQCELNCSRDE